MIHPTVGRIVWYHPCGADTVAKYPSPGGQVIHAAVIVHIWGDSCVNLMVFDSVGMPYTVEDVILRQEDSGPQSFLGRYAEWMPYQKAAAAGTQAPTLHAVPS